MIRIRGICALAMLLSSVVLLNAQNPPSVAVVPFSESGVTFEPYNPAISPTLAKLVEENPRAKQASPQGAVLINNSGRDIVLVTVRWTTPAPEQYHTFRLDGLFLAAGKPAVPPNSQLLVTPEETWLDSGTGGSSSTRAMAGAVTGTGTGSGSARQALEGAIASAGRAFPTTTYTTIELDTVIFADGTFIGADRSQTIPSVSVRKEIAGVIAKAMLTALDAGENPEGALREFANRTPRGEADHSNEWYARIAKMALAAPPQSRRAFAGQLLAIPDVSNLRRIP